MSAYYNEIDPFAASWLRELIKDGQIAPGEVDERSIWDVMPDDLRGFSQCHFFAGIGVWSYALRRAGWPDNRPVWTGSCPCQPFSAAGKRKGTADERHLWPAFFHLIGECHPRTLFGEQVASKDCLAWIDTVLADLESEAYASWAFDLCSAGFGAPHIRQRLYFVGSSTVDNTADARHNSARQRDGPPSLRASRFEQSGFAGGLAEPVHKQFYRSGAAGAIGRPEYSDGSELGDTGDTGLSERIGDGRIQREALEPFPREAAERTSNAGELGHTNGRGSSARNEATPADGHRSSSLTAGFWADCEWIPCRDGKYRPIEPGTAPLATGITNRVGKLRGYGNALTAQVAKGFIEAYLEAEREIGCAS